MSPAVTDDALLGGRLRYRQFLDGYRTGIEPVLLAAAVPARAGQSVLEAGCGAGAALLCLSSRVPGVIAHGIEADAETLEVARWNMRSNGFDARLHQAVLPRLPADGLPDGPDPRQPGRASFDHILCNPPWHRGNATASPVPKRDLARRAAGGLLGEWIAVLAPLLVPGGSFSLILPAALHAEACAALLRGGLVGGIALVPFWPRVGRPAKIVLLQGRRGSRAPSTILPGLLLHEPGGVYSADAERILRDGAALELQRWSPGR
ncbi:tRNA1(Val) (adenine(37)-N6)-methyltransferase [Lichenicoccus roseus]|uniref:Methyltransferase n=1 Tax=Lichenicoccus roseus TaxID=2683649 RepID=A0A5R9J6C1_9PROT|nr:methyltransferase [Lichenicoccus roseus]TLU72047.1 methyltransferase [Lichenicoccus roseus]